MSQNTAPGHLRLDAAMKDRRETLRTTWANVASEAGITVETLRAIRRGHNKPSLLTKRGIEGALLWEPGSIDRIFEGGEPTPLRQDAPAPPEPVAAPTVIPESPETGPPTPGEGESAGMSQVDAIRAALRAELTTIREEVRQMGEENKAALERMSEEFRAFREQSGA